MRWEWRAWEGPRRGDVEGAREHPETSKRNGTVSYDTYDRFEGILVTDPAFIIK